MRLSVLAFDYDGTITSSESIDDTMRGAIAKARSNGAIALLVTGRILSELQRVAGALHFVDGVVAENGAVVHFPDGENTSILAPTIPPVFVGELVRGGIPHVVGSCLVDANADDGPRLLEIIRRLELPLVLAFNRGRVMVLPQGISKATGLQRILEIMRLSPRNTIAFGDAENDHELLRLAEIGVAVQWGSQALQRAADLVIDGTGPAAIAANIAALASRMRLPTPARARRRLRVGYTEDGREFSLAVRGRNVLVAGDAKSGKSWVAGLLCEQLILHGYCVCVLDPEGDYRSLERLPGVSVVGGDDPPPTALALMRALRYSDQSVVVDLSQLAQNDKIEYIRVILPALNEMRRRRGLPHRIVLDEAHYFLDGPDACELLDLEANGYTIVTYCASRLPQRLLDATEVMIVTCESNPVEVQALRSACDKCRRVGDDSWRLLLGRLQLGQAVALPITEETGGEITLFTIGSRLTPHVRHREKYCDVPVSERHAFVFDAAGDTPLRRVRTLRDFVTEIERTPHALAGYLRRGDFSRWIADVFGDRALAIELRAFEERYREGSDGDTPLAIADAIRGRYDLTPEADTPPSTVSPRAA